MSTPLDWDDTPDWSCSMIQSAQDTATRPASFRQVLTEIASPRWAEAVSAVRQAYATGGKDAAAEPKKRLAGVLFSGTFSRRAASALIQHSGLICADLDELGDAIEPTFELVASDPHTLACFRSPTGTGLKVVCRVDPSKLHAESFRALEHYMLEHFGLEIDQACKDVSRICFVSHDPEAFVADNSTPLPYPPAPTEFTPTGLNPRSGLELTPGDDYDARGDFSALLVAHGWTKCAGGWTRPGKTVGLSATFDKVPGRFYVFSSSVSGFAPQHVYRPWHVYAILEHGGNFSDAAKALGEKGFGNQVPSRQQNNLDRISGPAPTDYKSRRVTIANKPPEPVTRLFLAKKPVATPGNLVTLISKAKTGKTAEIGAVVAAIVAAHYDRPNLDTLGFTAPHTKEAVVQIDTEQSLFDAHVCHQRAFARANQETDVDWLLHYALVGYGAEQLKSTLVDIMSSAKSAHGGVFILILDGVADFVKSVNDEAECNDFITWLRAMAVQYDCPVICVIHSNEAIKAGDDGRGHLGKQLTRKAESNLLLKKVGEVTTVTSEKQRKAPITEADGIAFQWSDEHQRHVSCGTPESGTKLGAPKRYNPADIIKCVPGPSDKPIHLNQIHRLVGELPCGISIRSFKDMMAKWVETGEVERVMGPAGHGFKRRY